MLGYTHKQLELSSFPVHGGVVPLFMSKNYDFAIWVSFTWPKQRPMAWLSQYTKTNTMVKLLYNQQLILQYY